METTDIEEKENERLEIMNQKLTEQMKHTVGEF